MQESCIYLHGQYDSEQRYKYRISRKCRIKSFEFLSLFCWIINTFDSWTATEGTESLTAVY